MTTKKLDDSADLGEMDGDEQFTFPPAERKVITQPLDLSIQTLAEQWESQVLSLPEIQREYVWDNGKASRLIESLLLNIPIPVLYFAETPDAKYEIIDGHQRVRSIVRFIKNEFSLSGVAVLDEYKGYRFHQLPQREQRFLLMRTLRAIIISADSHPSMKFEIFERLNTGAISLNAQELRNSIYRGPFNNLLHELAKEKHLRELLGTKLPRRRMVDEELILRFLALRAHLDIYRPPLKRFLNLYMEETRQSDEQALQQARTVLESSTTTASLIFGDKAFRVTDPTGQTIDPIVNRALFDCQMLACSWVTSDVDDADVDLEQLRANLAALFNDNEFLDSIQRATGDRTRTLKRLRDTVNAMQEGGLTLEIPFQLAE